MHASPCRKTPRQSQQLKMMVDELAGDPRVSVYFHGTDFVVDRGWDFVLLWERGDPLALALIRLKAIVEDPSAGRAPRSGETGEGLEP
jgi:hypothetical protein